MNILVTGGSGFLGSHILQELNGKGHTVSCLVNKRNIAGHSINSYRSVEELPTDFDLIFHTAAFIPYGKMNEENALLDKVNVDLTRELMLKFPTARFVFSSTVSVYGKTGDLISIESKFNQPSRYGQSKIKAEQLVNMHRSYAVIRFTSLVGAGMNSNSFIWQIVHSAKTKSMVNVFGKGARLQNYLDVRDAARLCIHVGFREENLTILGVSNKSYSNLQVAEMVAELTGAEISMTGSDHSESKVYDYELSYSQAQFLPKYSLLDSIKSMV